MFQIRKSDERGGFDFGWLRTQHSFSFGDYFDRRYMGFSVLRVINEDFIEKGQGFPTHPHKNMEIVTYVISGVIAHRDSLGTSSSIFPGEVQRMSAGKGIRHSEYNGSNTEDCHLLQIWIQTEKDGIEPSYEQKSFKEEFARGGIVKVVDRVGADSSCIGVHQDVRIYAGRFKQGDSFTKELDSKRSYWVQLISGEIESNAGLLKAGDGLAISAEGKLDLKLLKDAHFLLFDLL